VRKKFDAGGVGASMVNKRLAELVCGRKTSFEMMGLKNMAANLM
jgi:hypothetical protein